MNARLAKPFYSIRYRRFGQATTIWKSAADSFLEAQRAYEMLLPDAFNGVLEVCFHPTRGNERVIEVSVR